MDGIALNGLVAQFQSAAQSAAQEFDSASRLLRNGTVLGEEEYQRLIGSYQELNTLYQEIYDQTASLSQSVDGKSVQKGLQVEEYRSLYGELLSKRDWRQTQEVRRRLSTFLLARSDSELYSGALAPVQEEVRRVMGDMDAETISPEELSLVSQKTGLFLDALRVENMGADASLVARISELFPSLVLAGLLTNSYYVPDEQEKETPAEAERTAAPVDAEEPPVQHEALSPAEPSEKEALHSSERLPSEVQKSAFLFPDKKLKEQSPNASSFKKDVRKCYSGVKFILPLLTNLGIMTVRQMVEFCRVWSSDEIPEDLSGKIRRVLDQLISKNLLAEYFVPELACGAFCLTRYCGVSMKKKEALSALRSFWEIWPGNFSYLAKDQLPSEEVLQYLERNDRLIHCLVWTKEFFPQEYVRVQGSLKRVPEYDVLALPVSDTSCYRVVSPEELGGTVDGRLPLGVSACGLDELNPESMTPVQGAMLLAADRLYQWDGSWQPQEGASSEEPPPEELGARDNDAQDFPDPADTRPEPPEEPASPLAEEVGLQDAPLPPQESKAVTPRSAQEQARLILEDDPAALSGEAFSSLLVPVLWEKRVVEATVFAQAAATTGKTWAQVAFHQLAYAVNSPLITAEYTSTNVAALDEQAVESPLPEPISRGARIGTLLWSHIFPAYSYDEELFNNYKGQFAADADALFSRDCDALRQVFPLLTDTVYPLSRQIDGMCFSLAAMQVIQSDSAVKQKLRELLLQAEDVLRRPMPRNSFFTGYDDLIAECIGPSSDLCKCMRIIQSQSEDRRFLRKVFSQFTEGPEDSQVSEKKVDEYIDQAWRTVRNQDKTIQMNRQLIRNSKAWNVLRRGLTSRLAILSEWMTVSDAAQRNISQNTLLQLKEAYQQLCSLLQTAVKQLDAFSASAGAPEQAAANLVLFSAQEILRRLSGKTPEGEDWRYIGLLSSGYISLDDSNFPELDAGDNDVHTFEPWYRMIQHLAAEQVKPETALSYITEESAGRPDWFTNYGIGETLMRYLSETQKLQPLHLEKAKKGARMNCDRELTPWFESEFRLACAYGKIDEDMEETAFQTVANLGKRFLEQDNYASYRRLLEHLLEIIPQETEKRRAHYASRLDSVVQAGSAADAPLAADIRTALDEENFALAEEYLSRLEEGERCRPEQDKHGDEAADYHQRLLDRYDSYYRECNKASTRMAHPRNWARGALKNLETFWSSPNQANTGYRLIESWIGGKDSRNTGNLIGQLLGGLGFSVDQVRPKSRQSRGEQYEVYEAVCRPDPCGKRDYDHPIAKFGTDMGETINVVCLFGCKGVSTVIQIMTRKLQMNGPTIVLLDGILSLDERRNLAAKFKLQTSGQSSFLLIDRVLLLYLAALDEGERKIAMLKCTLPYTFEQPFTNGAGVIPDEMFFGRVRERRDLCDKAGSHLVYGGRQLGKTALLLRCCSIQHKPSEKLYAYYFLVKAKTSDGILSELRDELARQGFVDRSCASLEDLCEQLFQAYRSKKFVRLQLFLDEVDSFFEEARYSNYELLRPFTNLMQKTVNQVKFVFAGLHNVAHTATANNDNSPLLYLGKPLCIAPLSSSDAKKLIERPLAYLGFSIGERELALILARTNYYPGLLHLFGYSLLQSVCSNYSEYYGPDRGNPPYQVLDAQMKAVFKKEDLEKEINLRMDATINGLDPQYKIISNLLAHLYYEDEASGQVNLYGYRPEQIGKLNVYSLRELSDEDLRSILNEMVDMGILSYNQEHDSYRLRKRSFLTVIGKPEKVEDTLLRDMERT